MREGSREGGDVRTIVSGASEDKRPSDRSSAVGSLSGKSDLRTLPGNIRYNRDGRCCGHTSASRAPVIERIPAARTDEEGVAREEEAGCTAVGVSQVQTNASRRMTCNRANRETQPYAIHAPIDPYSDTDGCPDARGYGSIVRPAASAWFGCWSMVTRSAYDGQPCICRRQIYCRTVAQRSDVDDRQPGLSTYLHQ
jgi:hypothetical protein